MLSKLLVKVACRILVVISSLVVSGDVKLGVSTWPKDAWADFFFFTRDWAKERERGVTRFPTCEVLVCPLVVFGECCPVPDV